LAAVCFSYGYADIIPISQAEKQESVNSHNEWRKNAGATAMRRMKWNDELARFAEAAASKCSFDHTTSESRKNNIGGFGYIGENIYVHTNKPTFKDAIDAWGGEEKDYDLASDTCKANAMCGHYTQITWSKTSEVGCAVSKCSNVEGFNHEGYLVFCNYGHGGNMMGEKPFERGTAGSKCQTHFNMGADSDGLCGEGGPTNTGNDNSDDVNSVAGNVDTANEDNAGDNNNDIDTENGSDSDNGGNNNNEGDSETDNGHGNNADQENNHGDNEHNENESDTTDNGSNQGTSTGKPVDCKDEIWYCHDWLQSCGEPWSTWACKKSCKFC